jgi:hypothetical protein
MSVVGCEDCARIRREIETAAGQRNPYWSQLAESNYRLHMKADHGIDVFPL